MYLLEKRIGEKIVKERIKKSHQFDVYTDGPSGINWRPQPPAYFTYELINKLLTQLKVFQHPARS